MKKKNHDIPHPLRRIPGFSGMESAPAHYLILQPDFTIVNASDIFLKNTLTRRGDIVGRNIFDVFPENPEEQIGKSGVSALRASFLRVLERRTMDMVSLMKYDIPRPGQLGGGFEERYWNPVNFPIFDKRGNISHLIHNSEDVTLHVMRQKQEMAPSA